jgi:hypothetical protein
MSAKDLFPTDINDFERQEGFEVVATANPDTAYGGHLATIQAVVRQVDKSHRVIKMRDSCGNVTYKLQRFGRPVFQDERQQPGWYPFGDEADNDPGIAVENARKRVDASREDQEFIFHDPPPLPAGDA